MRSGRGGERAGMREEDGRGGDKFADDIHAAAQIRAFSLCSPSLCSLGSAQSPAHMLADGPSTALLKSVNRAAQIRQPRCSNPPTAPLKSVNRATQVRQLRCLNARTSNSAAGAQSDGQSTTAAANSPGSTKRAANRTLALPPHHQIHLPNHPSIHQPNLPPTLSPIHPSPTRLTRGRAAARWTCTRSSSMSVSRLGWGWGVVRISRVG